MHYNDYKRVIDLIGCVNRMVNQCWLFYYFFVMHKRYTGRTRSAKVYQLIGQSVDFGSFDDRS